MTGYTAARIDNNRIKLYGAPDPNERESALVQMLWALEDVDCYNFGEGAEYGAGMHYFLPVYSCYSGLVYIVDADSDGAQILEGHEPEEWEREEIARDVYGEPVGEVFTA